MRTKDKLYRLLRLYAHRLHLPIFGRSSVSFPVLANSVPKAGSHLLARCLELMGVVYNRRHIHDLHPPEQIAHALQHIRAGEFLTAHLSYRPEWEKLLVSRHVRMVLIIRDPRDVAVSHFHYVTYLDKRHRLRPYYIQMQSDAERLMTSIRGLEPPDGNPLGRLPNIDTRFRSLLAWERRGACVVRFEELVGPHGGGTREDQVDALWRIARHLDIEVSSSDISRIAQQVFYPKSATFRKGVIGDWKRYFTEEHKRVFKEIAGPLLIELGYERDEAW